MAHMTTWHLECSSCGLDAAVLCWDYEVSQKKCSSCGGQLEHVILKFGKAPGVIGDELNNYSARHGVCHPDGTPRKFNSKTELKQALNEAGLTIHGDTPKPYHVQWSGKVAEPEKVAPIARVVKDAT